jgi:hypothetical protein
VTLLIYYYSLSEIPGPNAHQIQTFYTCIALSKNNKIVLFCPSNRNLRIKINKNFEILKIGNIKIKFRYFRGIEELLNNFLLGFQFFLYSINKLPDFFYTRDIYTPTILLLFKNFHKKPIIYETHIIKYLSLKQDYKLWGFKKPNKIKSNIVQF